MPTNKVAVVGVGYTEYRSVRSESRGKAEIAFDSIKSALDSAGLSVDSLDACYFATVDGFEGVNRVDRTIDAFGQNYYVPVVSINTGGTAGGSAFKEAYHAVQAGIYDIVAVYGSSTTGDVVEAQQILNTASPPIFEKPFGLGAIHMAAFYCGKYMRLFGATEMDYAQAAEKNHKAAAINPYAHVRKGYSAEQVLDSPVISWPLHLYEICPVSSGAAAVILASADVAKKITDRPVWIEAMGSITNTFLSGYRDYGGFHKLAKLAERIYAEAGIRNPLTEINVAEVFNPFSPFEILEYEALGFCEEGEGLNLLREGVTSKDGKLPVNMSGGVLCTNSGIAASVTRHAEIALQLMGMAGERQVKNAEVGLAHSWGGNLGQFHTLAVMSVRD